MPKSIKRSAPGKKSGRTPKPAATPAQPAALPEPEISLRSSRRFWLWTLLGLLVVIGGIQAYGYFTGWGNPERVVQRRLAAGQKLTLAKRWDAAMRQYEKVLSMQTGEENHRQALIALADLHRERQEWAKAQELYQELRQQQPQGVLSAWAGLQIADIALQSGRLDEAAKGYTEIMTQYPKSDWDAEARLGLGQVLAKQERYPEAIARFRGLVADYGGGFLAAEALVHMGECYEALGEPEQARQAYETVLQKYPAPTWDDAKARLDRMNAGKPVEGVRTWGQGK